MKNGSFLVFVFGYLACGCTLDSQIGAPELSSNIQSINMCSKHVGAPYTWQNLQLRNTGEDTLAVTNIEIRGNTNCAFQCFRENADGQSPAQEYPCPEESENTNGYKMTIWPGDTRLVRIVYTASGDGIIDQAALVITSDAPNLGNPGQLVIPMCGLGVTDDALENSDDCEDAGLTDGSCGSDPAIDCPRCEEILPETTPGCASI